MSIQVHTSTVAGTGSDLTNNPVGAASSNGASAPEHSETAKGDTVSLSGVSNLIAFGKETSLAARQAKIESLTALVRSGQYHPNANDVSRAIVQDMMAE
jgi:anti-sigma28 factor (negative regulator of flagellin synthesis)